jgi:cytochrome b561
VIANLAIGLLHESLLRGTIPLRMAIGLTVLALTVGRILWRLGHRPPPLPAEVPTWVRGSAHALHMLLYGLMLAMRLSDWAMLALVAIHVAAALRYHYLLRDAVLARIAVRA